MASFTRVKDNTDNEEVQVAYAAVATLFKALHDQVLQPDRITTFDLAEAARAHCEMESRS